MQWFIDQDGIRHNLKDLDPASYRIEERDTFTEIHVGHQEPDGFAVADTFVLHEGVRIYREMLEDKIPEGWRVEHYDKHIIITARPRHRMRFVIDEFGALSLCVPHIEGLVDTSHYLACTDPVRTVLEKIATIEDPSLPDPELP